MPVVGATFGQRNASGNTVSATRTFAPGSFGLALCALDAFTGDTTITFSGGSLTYNEIAAVDQFVSGDGYSQEAAWFSFPAGGSLTVTATSGANRDWAGLVVVELAGVIGFDKASYLRTTSNPNCGSATNADELATRVAIGVAWGSGTLAVGSGFTDLGAGANYAGASTMRVQSVQDATIQARTMAFGTGTGTSPFFCSQFIFPDASEEEPEEPRGRGRLVLGKLVGGNLMVRSL